MVFLLSRVLLVQFIFLYLLFPFTFTISFPLIHPKCHDHESHALLQFKKVFHINKSASLNPFGYPKTASWNSTTDCCSWDGIQCDELTNQVIQIDLSSSQIYGTMDANSSLFRLVHLRHLDLSDNDFNYSQIPSRIGLLSQLAYLKLVDTNFFGEIPPQISKLSKLLFLELGINDIESSKGMVVSQLNLKVSTLKSLIQNSTKLETLALGLVTIASTLPDTLTNLTSLKNLLFLKCELHGEFPLGVFNLPNLKSLQLGFNPNLNGKLPEFQSNSLTNIILDYTSFNGRLPVSIGKLSSLKILSIPGCNFFEYIPSSFANLTQLMDVNLDYNKFKGDLSASMANLTKLAHLGVAYNEFTVETISWIGKLTSLVDLDITSVNIGSDIPLSFANLTQLEFFNAQNCNLKGEIPSWIMNLTNLVSFNVAYNCLHGNVELDMFLKLKRLAYLSLSFNKLLLYSGKSSLHMTDSQIQFLFLDSCNLVEIPTFIRNLNDLEVLSLGENNIHSLPNWLWKKANLQSLEFSNNSLTGTISPSICNLKSLVVLDLALNNLSGNVPSCLGNFSQSLKNLILHGNKLSGLIPQAYMIGNSLHQIDLSNNNLQGQLPRELVDSRRLEYFDVSHNNINDSFPFWLGDLPELKVLALSNNEFHGDIRCPGNMTCTFRKLHIIDLSHNDFSGSIPSQMIQSWKAMKTSNTSQLQYDQNTKFVKMYNEGDHSLILETDYSFMMSNKGMLRVYENLQEFYTMIAIDISSNKISGEIPQAIGDLKGLIFLNLSNNILIGSIPSSLRKLSNLEALDLSLNSLSGKIPQQLTQLTFLAFFNVSFNNLSGPIPQNEQFATFQDNSFEGNQGLCGDQLLKKCIDHREPFVSPPSDGDNDSESLVELYWIVILIGYVGGLVAGLALGSAFYPDVVGCLKRHNHKSNFIATTVSYNSGLYGEFPIGVFHLPNLEVLDLRYNPNLKSSLPEFQSSSLTKLFLDKTGFYGLLPISIGKLSSLKTISIPNCNFFGYIPSSFGNLTQLKQLSLERNKFRGDPSASLVNLTKLSHLIVGYNDFIIETISWIGKLSSMIALDISSINITNGILLPFANLTQIQILIAKNSNLKGEIPHGIMNLRNLALLDLSYNFLHGKLKLDMFLNLKNLVLLDLSYNKLSLYSGNSSSHMTDSQIQVLELASCNLDEIPTFIRNLGDLEYLMLSSNNITSLPNWLWRKESLQILIVSNSSLTGKVSPSICNLKSLVHLDLSYNNLSGKVPSCLGNFSQSLENLVLKGNKLSGLIPQTYMIGNALQSIDFSDNNLNGKLPRALVNCAGLEYFDISHNNINDLFPFWLGDLPELKLLALSNNEFQGDIRCSGNMTCKFPKLHIIDLSHNQFSGSFPSEMIQSWKAMKTSNTSQLQYGQTIYYSKSYKTGLSEKGSKTYSFTISNKGLVMTYGKLQQFYSNLIAIDISSNQISGEIPQVLGDLDGLILLNLSNNILNGSIPSSLGKLSNLEALDLSFNHLSGKLPQQLAQLTFLEFLNVSFNNLSGPIPQNKQFATFQDNSFEGNQGLCGDQLLKKCIDHREPYVSPPSASDDDHESESLIELYWYVILIGYVGGLVGGVALGSAFYPDVVGWLKRFF